MNIRLSQQDGDNVIFVAKSQSFLRTPLVSMIVEGEDWLVGFDQVFEVMADESLLEFDGLSNYPVSRIVTHNNHGYQIQIDLGGFGAATPRVKMVGDFLVVTGNKTEYAERENQNYLQKGISARGFRRSFQLGRDARVVGSNLQQGILQIEIEHGDQLAMEPVSDWVRAG